ncbi:MAG: methyltransferase domain-containing protein [Gemmatimonadetes bacterium]|nr:methyltransferase domain-containing protein [Gemmatimonadota bacterium]
MSLRPEQHAPPSPVPARRPTVRDLVALAAPDRGLPGGEALYRHAALLAGLGAGDELLSVGCGTASGLRFLVERYGVHGSGVDVDPHAVEGGEARSRGAGLAERMHVQAAPMDALPYRDGIFDVTLAELGLTARALPGPAIQELARVTRPGGTVLLIQLAWTAPVPEGRRHRIEALLGFRPLAVVEWKRLLGDAGIDAVHAEDWTEGPTALMPRPIEPLLELADRLSWRARLDVSRLAWRRWGLRGALDAWGEGSRLQRLLARERVLSLVLLKGTRRVAPPLPAPPVDEGVRAQDVSDLPLFGPVAGAAR